MNDALLIRERNQLLPRIRPGTGYTADLTKAANRCFEWADALHQRRRALTFDSSLSPQQRKDELARIVSEEMLPDLAGVVEPVKRAKAFVEGERKKLQWGNGLDRATAAVLNDAAVVDAALFFVKREARGIGGVTDSDLDMLTMPGMSG